MKKYLACLLSLTLVLGFLPTSAYAEELSYAPPAIEENGARESKAEGSQSKDLTFPQTQNDNTNSPLSAFSGSGVEAITLGFQESIAPLAAGDTISVTGITAGTLQTAVESDSGYVSAGAIKNLTIAGTLDATDFAYIRTITNLVTLNISNITNTSLPDNALENLGSLTTVTLPIGLTSLGARAFHSCSSLTDADLSKVTSFGEFAFSFCTNLKALALPATKPSIGPDAFDGVPPLLLLIKNEDDYDNLDGFPTDSNYVSMSGASTLVEGDTLSLAASSAAGSSLTYQWYEGSTLLSGETSDTFSKANIALRDNGKAYSCDITLGSITNRVSTTITVNALVHAETPAPPTLPTSASYTQNDAATALDASTAVSDGGTLSYQWYEGTTPISGATTGTADVFLDLA
ncbi:MAG: leucine-rich repeat domain-containing protein [Raoultibacter sp.]